MNQDTVRCTEMVFQMVNNIFTPVVYRFELLPQIDKISKSAAYKLYLIEKNVIHVSVYLPDGVCFMSKVALRVKESDEIMTVVREFVSGIREEQKLQSIGFKVFTSIS